MANLVAYGATDIANQVKELLAVRLQSEDWGMQYSNMEHGYVFNRNHAFGKRVFVAGGNREGVIDVILNYGDKEAETWLLKGNCAVEEAVELVLANTRN